jgi:hypothetical protein
MDSFDEETRTLIDHIHHAWKSKASLSQYALLRDKVVAHHDRLDIQVSALNTVVRLAVQRLPACKDVEDSAWQNFFSLAASWQQEGDQEGNSSAPHPATREYRRNYNENNRRRNLAIVVALWSAEVVQYYGWGEAGQGQAKVIRACAVQFPDFKVDLGPRLNSVLLTRHCLAIRHCQGRTLNEARLQPYKDLDVETLSSASIDIELEEQWLSNQDGAVQLDHDGMLLKDVRPSHFRLYLLQRDRYGILEMRKQFNVSRSDETPILSPSRATQDLYDEEMIGEMIQSQLHAADGLDESTLERPLDSVGVRCTSHARVEDSPRLHGGVRFPETDHFDSMMDPARAYVPSVEPSCLRNMDVTLLSTPGNSVSEPNLFSTQQSPFESYDMAQPSTVLHDEWWEPDLFTTCGSNGFPGLRRSIGPDVVHQQLDEVEHSAAPTTPTFDVCTANGGLRKRTFATEVDVQKRSRRSCPGELAPAGCSSVDRTEYHNEMDEDVEPWCSSPPYVESLGMAAPRQSELNSGSHFLISSPLVEDFGGLSIEEKSHNRHHLGINEYVEKLASSVEGQRWIRAQWLKPSTPWATVWSSSESLGRGQASCEEGADVLYYAAADFVNHAEAGKVFCKPVVIKEEFTDHSMHTIAQFMELIQDSCSPPLLDVRGLDSKDTVPMRADKFAHLVQFPSDVDDGFNAINLRNLTKSHRPRLTMLPRFRLLESLSERLYCNLGKQTALAPADVSACIGFNTVGLPGAFSGAHVDALCGTWIRNLEGIKYWMIVPETEMALEWDNFADEGNEWLPSGKERLIVLEKDDVLLMPPGLRVVHAVHSPVSGLMEGGMLWDSLNVLEILRSILWICENQLATNEAIAFQLPRTIENLKHLLHVQAKKCQGPRNDEPLLGSIGSAIQALENLGCKCSSSSCGMQCECIRSRRRCNAWCADHTELPSSECMYENAPC